MAATSESRPMKSNCSARMPKRRLRSTWTLDIRCRPHLRRSTHPVELRSREFVPSIEGRSHSIAGLPQHIAGRSRKTELPSAPSALSQQGTWVDGLEFISGVVDLHVPVDAALGRVHVGRPSGSFGLEGFDVAEAATRDALPGQ